MLCSRCGIENAPFAQTCCGCGAFLHPKSASICESPEGMPATQAANVGPIGWYLTAIKKYAVFTGRARRREFWYFFLFQNLIIIALMTLSGLIGSANGPTPFGVLAAMYAIATMIPALAVSVRRLHDINLSGWLFLLVLIPLVGSIILLGLCAQDSKLGKKQYDPSAKADPDLAMQKPTPAADIIAGAPSNLGVAPVQVPQTSTTPAPSHPESRERVSPQVQAEESAADTMVFRTKGGAMKSAESEQLMPSRGFPKWAILAAVGLAFVIVCAFGLITFRLFTRYKYLDEKGIQFRIDRYSGRTEELAGTSGWVPVSFNRPSEKIPSTGVANIQLSGMERLENQACFNVNNESDYTVKSITVMPSVNAKGGDQDSFARQLQELEGTLSLQPVGPLLQKGKTGMFCASWDGAADSTAGSSGYTVLGAKGWKEN